MLGYSGIIAAYIICREMDERNGMGERSYSVKPRDEGIYTTESIVPPSFLLCSSLRTSCRESPIPKVE